METEAIGRGRRLALRFGDHPAVGDGERQELRCGARPHQLDRVEREPVSERAQERAFCGDLYPGKEGEACLFVPAAGSDGHPARGPRQGARDQVGLEQRAPIDVGRDLIREEWNERIPGGREDRRTLSPEKGGDVSETLWPARRRVDGDPPSRVRRSLVVRALCPSSGVCPRPAET